MESLIVCRHAESEFNVRGVINGDPANAGSAARDPSRDVRANLLAALAMTRENVDARWRPAVDEDRAGG